MNHRCGPPLTVEQRRLIEAHAAILEGHVAGLRRRYRFRRADPDAIESAAWWGCLRACRTWRPDSGRPFAAYAWLKMDGEVRQYLRRRREDVGRIEEDPIAPGRPTADAAADRLTYGDALARLYPDEAAVLRLYCEGWSFEAIRDATGLSFGTVHRRCHAALEKVRAYLETAS